MPMPSDPTVKATSQGLVDTLQGIFGPHPGYRPAHAKGLLIKGTFTPSPLAATLSTAKHFNQPETPVLARFSSSTGFPKIPDTDSHGQPRGFAIRFILSQPDDNRRAHTDIITHSADGFPCSTGEETLQFFKSVKDGSIGSFLETHPKAKEFIAIPKPFPETFVSDQYFGVNAFKLVAEDKITVVRYRVTPVNGDEGLKYLSDAADKGSEYLYDNLRDQLANGSVVLKVKAQVAEDGDITNDATEHWPSTRKVVELGELKLSEVVDDPEEQKNIIFDPIPRVDGIEPSDDPLLEVRAGVYIISGKERRGATLQE